MKIKRIKEYPFNQTCYAYKIYINLGRLIIIEM